MADDDEDERAAPEAIYVSYPLRDLDARLDPNEPGYRPAKALAYDDRGNPIAGTPMPWRAPRPPEPPPPRALRDPDGREVPTRLRGNAIERRAYTEQLWRSLYDDAQIIDVVSQYFGCSVGTVRNDLKWIRKRYHDVDNDSMVVKTRKSQMRALMVDILQESRARNDPQTTRYMADKLAKLDGLYAPQKMELVSAESVGFKLDDLIDRLSPEGRNMLEAVLMEAASIGAIKAPTGALPVGNAIDVEAEDTEERYGEGFDGQDDGDHDDDDDDDGAH